MTFKDAISLGRISNLPTVWTNVVAALVLSGAEFSLHSALACCAAMSLMYTGGMYLNDAFDREIDALQRPERPIPAGRVTAKTVFIAGFAQLAVGVAIVGAFSGLGEAAGAWLPALGALGLAGLIVLYDAYHKNNPMSPLLMGLCRVAVYVTVALFAAGTVGPMVLLGALVLLCYLIGLTYTAKQENLGKVTSWWPLFFLGAPFIYAAWKLPSAEVTAVAFPLLLLLAVLRAGMFLRESAPRVPKAVVTMIAAISLVDATLVSLAGHLGAAGLCVVGFGATLLLQRWVSGT